MKRFRFTLQALLDMKISLEKEKKNELSIVQSRINTLESERNKLMDEMQSNIDHYLQMIKEQHSVSQIRMYNSYMKLLRSKIGLVEMKIEEENIVKQEIQKILAEIVLERKSLENLKENQRKQYMKEIKKENEAIVEEFASFNYSVNKIGGD